MLKELQEKLNQGASLEVDKFGNPTKDDLITMAAVLLVYMGRSEASVQPEEQKAMMGALAKQFSLNDEDSSHILEVAGFLIQDERKIDEFTSTLREAFDKGQLVTLLGMVWRVVQADGVVSEFETATLEILLPRLGLSKDDLNAAIDLFDSGKV